MTPPESEIDREELKPCPFCGDPVELERVREAIPKFKKRPHGPWSWVSHWFIRCECGVETAPDLPRKKVFKHWNIRQPEKENQDG